MSSERLQKLGQFQRRMAASVSTASGGILRERSGLVNS